jgi:activator of HSP90 ATPase
MEHFKISIELNASPEKIYKMWMSSKGHAELTGDAAAIKDKLGENFTAFNGYISGKNLELVPGKKIVQTWRTTEFEDDDPDSMLEIILEPKGKNTLLTLIHTELPHGDGEKYKTGWQEFYFEPMQEYFEG